jgi:hypothetical protein
MVEQGSAQSLHYWPTVVLPLASDWTTALTASKRNHMVISTNIPVNKMARQLAGITKKHDGGESALAWRRCRGC